MYIIKKPNIYHKENISIGVIKGIPIGSFFKKFNNNDHRSPKRPENNFFHRQNNYIIVKY